MTLPERINAYVNACPPAISGQGGHNQTFTVACALVNGFQLSENDAIRLMEVYNQKCQPPWTEKEIAHKVKTALSTPHDKPRGHLIGTISMSQAPTPKTPAPKAPPEKPTPVMPERKDVIPSALLSPTTALLLMAFKKGEGVSVCPVKLNEEGRSLPDGSGTVYERDNLIALLKSNGGDPNKLIPCQHGAYIRVNPMEIGPKSDADKHVTSHRHVLVEFDNDDQQGQWLAILQSGAPCAAVLTSGGQSIHAWVTVNAKDATEYAERRDAVYSYFVPLGADPKNKNPSRYSRLPGMKRGEKVQQLLAISIGASSFEQWMVDRAAAGIGTHFTIESIIDFNPKEDKDSLIGDRWLCRGSSCLTIGQTHVGKSSFGLQMAVVWGLNGPFFGITPIRSLKSVYVQAENDLGDIHEMLVGILKGLKLWHDDQKKNRELIDCLRENLIIIRDQSNTGKEFATSAAKLIAKHKPDLFWMDPILSFYGGDVNDQKYCSSFLRNWLNPISEATGVIWMPLHHTGKPMKDAMRTTKSWTTTEFAYQGIGSSEFANWTRASITIHKIGEDEFRVVLGKRGWRAGATDKDGTKSTDLYLAHSPTGICWNQIERPPLNGEFKETTLKFAQSFIKPATASEIIKQAGEKLNRGTRTLWKLWDRGQGPLGKYFQRHGDNLYVPKKYVDSDDNDTNLPYPD